MRVLVCVKRVPAPGARINLTADEQAIDTAHLGFTTSPHEECAVEAAAQLVEAHGGSATVLTVGPPEAEEQLRYAVSVGMAAAVLVPTDGADWDPQRTAGAVTSVRPAPVRQRVRRLRRVPGGDPRRPRARAADRQRRQGHRAGR
jgi:electron transfer flavoprotein beta subunit